MSSLGGDKARGPREKTLPTVTHSSQPQKQIQATAEQIRLAQVIYDKNDSDSECKVNQLMEVTGKNQDECMIALHDCNEDVNRAINFLLESTSDTTSWETVGKKKPLVKEGPSESKENKENREKKGDKEANKGRSASSRRGKGASRSRPAARPEENGVEVMPVERGSERGRRGRGAGGRGRGRAPPGSRFSAQGMGTFNPADYTSDSRTRTMDSEVWDTGANGTNPDGTAWRNTLEDWAAEDWSEDVSLSETKVFTSSCAPAAENHITPGQSLDLATLLQKPVGGGREAPPSSSSSSSQSLVFTNSHHHHHQPQQPQLPLSRNATGSTSYAHVALSSVLGAGFGDLGQSKRSQPSAGAQILEQLKGPGLGPLPSSQATPSVGTQGGRLPGLGVPVPPPVSSSWDLKVSEPGASSQFSREFGMQPEPSLVLSQLVQRHAGPSLPLARQPSPPTQRLQQAAPAAPSPGLQAGQGGPLLAAGSAKSPAPSAGLDPPGSGTPHQQQRAQLKGQKRRIPPTSKIPSTAVEMPGSADIPGLNLQFGALDFGSESAIPDFGAVENCVVGASRESTPGPVAAPTAPGPQSQSSLYSTPLSESLGLPLSVPLPLPISSSEPVYHSPSITLPNLSASSLGTASSANPHAAAAASSAASALSSSVAVQSTASPFCSVGGSYDAPLSVHSRLAFTQSKEASGPVMVSGTQEEHVVMVFGVFLLSGKAPPNLSQGVPPLLPNQYIMGPGGLLPAYPQIYGYEDLHMLQSRLPMDYYGITFPGPAALSGRDGSLANNPYSGEVTKFGRNDSTSPAPPTSLSAPQPPQGQSQGQSQGQPQQPQAQGQPQHHGNQQAFLPPGYSYTGLPYYPGVPSAVPSAAAFQYGPTMFVPPGAQGPASGKQHGMGLGLGNPSASPFQQQSQQQPSGYGQHTFSSGYEELTAGPAGVDYSKGYSNSSQAQAKSAASGPGKGVSVTSSNSGVPDISGSVYNKSQAFDKQGFHAGTPPPFSLPSALGGPGPLNPGGAPGGYAPAPFLHILPHQQPHSQLLHHHLAQDGQGGPSQRGQSSSMQQKSQVNKSSYGSSPYWAN
uniref:Ubiquitin associated protein 2a n=1 Tax=Gadus morhua TaxID=8049 RepID=A0A8C4ZX30_GADMO